MISLKKLFGKNINTNDHISMSDTICLGRRRRRSQRWGKNIRKLGYAPTGFKLFIIFVLSEELRYYFKILFSNGCFKCIFKIKSWLTLHTLQLQMIVPLYAVFEPLTEVRSGSPSAKPASIVKEDRFMLLSPLMFSHLVNLEVLEEENYMY